MYLFIHFGHVMFEAIKRLSEAVKRHSNAADGQSTNSGPQSSTSFAAATDCVNASSTADSSRQPPVKIPTRLMQYFRPPSTSVNPTRATELCEYHKYLAICR